MNFAANLGSNRCYIQLALEMRTSEKREQEIASLLGLRDSFEKIVLVRDEVKPLRDDYGILTMNVLDFLLNEDSLGPGVALWGRESQNR